MIEIFPLTDATFPSGTISNGTWQYDFAPASMVDPHPATSAYSVGWYYSKNSLCNPIIKNKKTNFGLADIAEFWPLIISVILIAVQ